jgi:membrane protease YdiL (CAAX protease family)
MLFLLKRTVPTALAALVVLAAAGLLPRWLIGWDAPMWPRLRFDWPLLLEGAAVCAVILCGDAVIHGGLSLTFGERYRARYRELAGVFRGQTVAALLAGAAMAGLGEELVFRGLSKEPAVLIALAVAFGLLHHVRRRLWPFTLWSVWEGLLFAAVLWWRGELAVTMTAHFLHDLLGFLIFRRANRLNRGEG